MMIVPSQGTEPFYRLKSVPVNFDNQLRTSIPVVYRYYDKGWYVHEDYLPKVVAIARSNGIFVDYHTLPDTIQIKIVANRNDTPTVPTPLTSPYAVLFLTPEAPDYVVKAVYRAMVKQLHPDHGGDPDQFLKIQEAYEQLTR